MTPATSPSTALEAVVDMIFLNEDIKLEESDFKIISTKVSVKLPANCFGLLKERSLAALRGLIVSGGVIDNNYTGETICLVINTSGVRRHYLKGSSIVGTTYRYQFVTFTRGNKGFGSTGLEFIQNAVC